ncbi:MAG: hypothetical protein ACRDHY_02070 [Anaerolineales bacterium]
MPIAYNTVDCILVLDAGGTDTYSDTNSPSGTGTDRTVVPKGVLGAQVDSDDPPP